MEVEWAIYYDDGERITDAEQSVEEVRERGVLVVAQSDPTVGRVLLTGRDYYWYEDGEWWGGDIFGLFDYLARPGMKRVLFGRKVNHRAFEETLQRAKEDDVLPPKSAGEPQRETY